MELEKNRFFLLFLGVAERSYEPYAIVAVVIFWFCYPKCETKTPLAQFSFVKIKIEKNVFFLFSFKRHSQQANDTLCVCMYGEYEATATMKKALHLYEIDMQNET